VVHNSQRPGTEAVKRAPNSFLGGEGRTGPKSG